MSLNHQAFFVSADDPPSKQALLKAALKLFVRDGFSGTDIRAIGKEAGYSNTAMFKFFKSKESLGLFIFERCYLLYADAFAAAAATAAANAAAVAAGSGRSFEASLDAVIDRFCEMFGESTEAFLFMQDHLREFLPKVSVEVRKKSVLAQAHRLIEQGKTEKKIRGEIDTKIIVAAFIGFLGQYARMVHFGEFKGGSTVWKKDIRNVIRKMVLN